MNGTIVFDPLLSPILLWLFAALVLVVSGVALWRGLSGWWLRAFAGLALLMALANPALQNEERATLSDIVVVVVDRTASQQLSDRVAQTDAALARVRAELADLPGTDIEVVEVSDGEGDGGTQVMTAIGQAMAELPQGRIAGVLVISDGQVHDAGRVPDLPAPLHVLLTGRQGDWDRRLAIRNAPAFGILDEDLSLTIRIEDQGEVPANDGFAVLGIRIDDGPVQALRVPVGRDVDVPLRLTHGGMNIVQLSVPTADGELTDRNNAAVLQINGLRDRLRVLLVSGEPHAGERTWRNLLKSDASVDLVHFTILRPPEKQDGVPVNELSLIAFPKRDLFLEKIDEFDLIIFDRYKRRGILPAIYLDNISRYVRQGGAVLVAAGPDYAGADSLYRSPLADVLPGVPTARVFSEGFRPALTDIGNKHPVTQGLELEWDAAGGPWGRWMRLIELDADRGHVLMSGAEEKPLLLLDRVEEGRVAVLASDHAWLWSRGYEGGGPQLELLRRLAHWMMKEPELEEDALAATATGQTMTITRRQLEGAPGPVEITGPDGAVITVPLTESQPGRFSATYDAPDVGLYRLAEEDQQAIVGLGPSAPREFVEAIATSDVMMPAIEANAGRVVILEQSNVDIRQVQQGRVTGGRGWIGITPRDAYLTSDVKLLPFAPAWLMLLLSAALAIGAWMREGQR